MLHFVVESSNLDKVFFEKHIEKYNVSYIELNKELKSKEDVLINNILNMIKISHANIDKEISKIEFSMF